MPHPTHRRSVVALVGALALIAASCGDSDETASASADTGGDAAIETGWSELDGVGVEALAFAGTTTDGESFSGADLVGQDVLLWFWAPW